MKRFLRHPSNGPYRAASPAAHVTTPTGKAVRWSATRVGASEAVSAIEVEAATWFDARAEASRVLAVGPGQVTVRRVSP